MTASSAFEYVENLVRSLMVNPAADVADDIPLFNGVKACWSLRGCHGLLGLTEAMEFECPHARTDCYSPCPAECKYTACSNPWHKTATDFNLILDDTVDRLSALKKNCYTCEYFLKYGPRISDIRDDAPIVPDAATADSPDSVTIHLF